MVKYHPLRRCRDAEVEMTFTEIEQISGALLPKAANEPDWSNRPGCGPGSAQCQAWLVPGHPAQPNDDPGARGCNSTIRGCR